MTFTSARKTYKKLGNLLRKRGLDPEKREEIKAYRRSLENEFGPSIRVEPMPREKRKKPSTVTVVIHDESGHEIDRLSVLEVRRRGKAYQEILAGLLDALRLASGPTPRAAEKEE